MENLTKDSFRTKIFDYESKREWAFAGVRPCVIDFYADWCSPCRTLSPVIEEVAREYAGKVDFYRIDTESESELTGMFGVQSIPTVLFIPKDGAPRYAIGALPKQVMVQAIEQVLGVPAQAPAAAAAGTG